MIALDVVDLCHTAPIRDVAILLHLSFATDVTAALGRRGAIR